MHALLPCVEATCYVGNLDDRVADEILYELFLQAGPIGTYMKFRELKEYTGGCY